MGSYPTVGVRGFCGVGFGGVDFSFSVRGFDGVGGSGFRVGVQ